MKSLSCQRVVAFIRTSHTSRTLRTFTFFVMVLASLVRPALGGPLAFIVSNSADGLIILDTTTNTVVRTIPGVPKGSAVAAHPDGSRAYVATPTGISLVDLNAPSTVNPVTQVLAIDSLRAIAVNPKGTQAYALRQSATLGDTLIVFNTETNKVKTTITVGATNVVARSLAVHPDGSKLYVTSGDSLVVADLATFGTTTINLSHPLDPNTGIGACNAAGVAVHPDGSKVYVTNENLCFQVPINPPDQGAFGSLAIVNTSTNQEIPGSPIRMTGRFSQGVAVTPDGGRVFVANTDTGFIGTPTCFTFLGSPGSVTAIDTTTNTVTGSFTVPEGAFGVGIAPDSSKVYVTNDGGVCGNENTVTVIPGPSLPIVQGPDSFGQFIGPSCASLAVARFGQCLDSTGVRTPWADFAYDSKAGATICTDGCALSSLAMALNFNGVGPLPGPSPLNPGSLNTFMISAGTYDGHLVSWDATTSEVSDSTVNTLHPNASLEFNSMGISTSSLPPSLGGSGFDVARQLLDKAICLGEPMVVGVKLKILPHGHREAGHFVVVTGRQLNSAGQVQYTIQDPASKGDRTTLDFYNFYFDFTGCASLNNCTPAKITATTPIFRTVGYVQDPMEDLGALTVSSDAADILMTDGSGLQSGFDATAGQEVQNIARSSYLASSIDNDETDTISLDSGQYVNIIQPASGVYNVLLQPRGTGDFSASVRGISEDGKPQPRIIISGISQIAPASLVITYNPTPGSTLGILGGFAGGGQRPRDVNQFLTYISPSDSPTSLPAGMTSFPLQIVYGSPIIPSTFSAVLNGADITSLFTPVPGTLERINLALQSGRNVLRLSVIGNLPGRQAEDTDELVFLVP